MGKVLLHPICLLCHRYQGLGKLPNLSDTSKRVTCCFCLTQTYAGNVRQCDTSKTHCHGACAKELK